MKNPTKEQAKQWNRTWYLKNKAKRRALTEAYKVEIRDWYKDLKSKLSCEKCGFSHPATISFHHKNPEEKDFDVSAMIGAGRSKKSIEKEISKCMVLCHNCHAILHYEERQALVAQL